MFTKLRANKINFWLRPAKKYYNNAKNENQNNINIIYPSSKIEFLTIIIFLLEFFLAEIKMSSCYPSYWKSVQCV